MRNHTLHSLMSHGVRYRLYICMMSWFSSSKIFAEEQIVILIFFMILYLHLLRKHTWGMISYVP